MTDDSKTRIGVTAVIVAVLVWGAVWTDQNRPPYIERCPEDSVLVGYGQFEDGVWTAYGCGPARDDYPN